MKACVSSPGKRRLARFPRPFVVVLSSSVFVSVRQYEYIFIPIFQTRCCFVQILPYRWLHQPEPTTTATRRRRRTGGGKNEEARARKRKQKKKRAVSVRILRSACHAGPACEGGSPASDHCNNVGINQLSFFRSMLFRRARAQRTGTQGGARKTTNKKQNQKQINSP